MSFLLTACGAAVVPRPALDHNRDGAAYLAEGDLDSAESSFRLALEYAAGLVEARANLGLVALQRGDYPAAEEHLRGALRIDDDFGLAWANLGVVLERRSRDDEAQGAYEEALRIDPGLADARYNLAHLLFRRGNAVAALAHLRRLILVSPDHVNGLALLAFVEVHLAQYAAAEEHAEQAIALRAEHPLALIARGTLKARAGDLDCALEDLRTAQADPRFGRLARVRLVAVHLLRGERVQAATLFAQLSIEAPDDPGLTSLARALFGDGRP